MTVVVFLPRTAEGRDLLREVLSDIRSADTRLFVAAEFDWDASAIEMRDLGLTLEPKREAR